MPIYNLIITDVTRYGELFCVAGWDLDNGGMIRPEPSGANVLAEPSRFWTDQHAGPDKFFAVGNNIRFDAASAPANFPFPHATEDRIFVAGNNSTILAQMTPSQIAQAVAPGVSASLGKAFGGQLHRAHSGKAHVAAGAQTCSLDAIEVEPESISFYEDNPSGKRRLRALIRQDGVEYDFSVPADAERSRFLAEGVAALEGDARACQRVHVRLGLCRPFAAVPNACYAQVNGLFFL